MVESRIFPFQLTDGILFEDSYKLLAWGQHLEAIKRIDNPTKNQEESFITWTDKKCFGGKILDVTVAQNQLQNANGFLESVEFGRKNINPRIFFKEFSEHFLKHFGQPTEIKLDEFDLPMHSWTFNDIEVNLGIGERFMEYSILRFSKTKSN
ncbi:hypothetical protein [Rufibacter ruber]|uniref:hypothetical protein n=1 Tax=Rufibacter ruber TaxID=1783499 RepID=UPI00082FC847|nr:hypothetical protein [Rufibacter ruber]